MRLIIFLSAAIIAAAINIEYCQKHELGMMFIGVVSGSWDVLDYFIKKS